MENLQLKMDKDLKLLGKGDLVTFNASIIQGGQMVVKKLKAAVQNVSNDYISLDGNYFLDGETNRRMMQPNIKVNGELKPLSYIKKSKIIDYQNLREEYTGKPTSKYEATELLREVIKKIISDTLSEDTATSTALYGGGNYNGIAPSYNQEIPIGQNKISDGALFPEDSLRIYAKKNMEDIKKQMNLSQKSTNDIEKKALEDFCFKYPSLVIYL